MPFAANNQKSGLDQARRGREADLIEAVDVQERVRSADDPATELTASERSASGRQRGGIVRVNPFRCRMWPLLDRLGDYITEQSCRAEIESFARYGQLVP